jgi:hypothetical protein
VERSHRIDADEVYRLLDRTVIDDARFFNNKLQEREDYYNYHRPRGGLDGHSLPGGRRNCNGSRFGENRGRSMSLWVPSTTLMPPSLHLQPKALSKHRLTA